MNALLLSAVACCLFAACLATNDEEKPGFDYRPGSFWFGECTTGKSQSPINIDTKKAASADENAGRIHIKTMGVVSKSKVFFTGSALEVLLEEFSVPTDVTIPANAMTIGNSSTVQLGQPLAVQPLQFHLHTKSEHTLDGFYAPGELHIVTKVKDGESDYCDSQESGCLAVFGVMLSYFEDGTAANPVIDELFKFLPSKAGKENGMYDEDPFNIDDLLPASNDYYTYAGGLTTPPCSEIVTWHVFKNPVGITTKEVLDHQKLVAFGAGKDCTYTFQDVCVPPREKTNHRDVQPLNGRTVYYIPGHTKN